ncbi:MAG: helix-turn-helix domain-containing protein [Candidatus Moranbacteria bacterium]|nr:helix-turn-helix domain-containing protein [Candidatus Moranbacteria bacterium]
MNTEKVAPHIGRNIQKYRNQKGFSQTKLSQLSGVSYNTLIKIEAGGSKNPTIETLIKLARPLEISVDQLLK